MQVGRILGIVGAILALVGTFLPWADISSDIDSISATGIMIFFIGIPVLIFAIIGLILVAIPKRGTAIGGLVMGILAFIFMLLAFVVVSILEGLVSGTGIEVKYEYGLWVTLVGSLLLIVGGAVMFVELGKVAAAPMPPPMMPPTPPPEEMPPPEEPPMEEPPVE